MRTLHHVDGNIPEPYVFNNRDDDYSLIIFSLVLIIIVWCIILYHFGNKKTALLIECPSGECATNLKTGEKRCPFSVDTILLRDPTLEVCNPTSSCTNSSTPYSINSDGSFNVDGDCPAGTTCRCTNVAQCPPFAQVMFTVQNGAKYTTNNGFTFSQTSYIGNTSTNGPGQITNINQQSCYINLTDTNRLTPSSCNESSFLTLAAINDCVYSNPCLQGKLTFVPDSNRNLTTNPFIVSDEGVTTRMACIAGPGCHDATNVPVFDWGIGQSVCVKSV